jgi:hypothetical protein
VKANELHPWLAFGIRRGKATILKLIELFQHFRSPRSLMYNISPFYCTHDVANSIDAMGIDLRRVPAKGLVSSVQYSSQAAFPFLRARDFRI